MSVGLLYKHIEILVCFKEALIITIIPTASFFYNELMFKKNVFQKNFFNDTVKIMN